MMKNRKFIAAVVSLGVTALGFTAIAVLPAGAATSVKLTAAQKAQLKYIVEEEKMARDIYAYLAANVTSQKFANIVKSEQSHMDQVSALLKAYGITNPTVNAKAGKFTSKEIQALYNSLIASGSAGITQAFAAGVTVEQTDIADLEKMLSGKFPTDVNAVLQNLLRGSQNHLAAFSR